MFLVAIVFVSLFSISPFVTMLRVLLRFVFGMRLLPIKNVQCWARYNVHSNKTGALSTVQAPNFAFMVFI